MDLTRFTLHAFERTKERLNLSDKELAKQLGEGLFLPIGMESNKIHKLFYSSLDDDCFVAVQGDKTKEVITILPLNYHHRWKISEEAKESAKRLVLGSVERTTEENSILPKVSGGMVKVRAFRRMLRPSSRERAVGLGEMTLNLSKQFFDTGFASSERVLRWINARLADASIKENEKIVGIFVELYGIRQEVDLGSLKLPNL